MEIPISVWTTLLGTLMGAGISQLASYAYRKRDEENADRKVILDSMRCLVGIQAYLDPQHTVETAKSFGELGVLWMDVKMNSLVIKSRRFRKAGVLLSILDLRNGPAVGGALLALANVVNPGHEGEKEKILEAIKDGDKTARPFMPGPDDI